MTKLYSGDTFGPNCICITVTVDMLYVCVASLSLQTLILFVCISVLYNGKYYIILCYIMLCLASFADFLPPSLTRLEVVRLWSLVTK